MTNRIVTGLAIAALAGCAGGTEPGTGTGTLTFDATDDAVRGSYDLDGETIEFESVRLDDTSFDVMVTLHGMVLSAVIDRVGQAGDLDGFAASGGETQIQDADRAALLALVRDLGTELGDVDGAGDVLVRAVDHWSETPDSVELQRLVIGEENRGWTSYCGSYGTYRYATHDGWGHSRWDADATSYAHVGSRAGSTMSYYSGAWRSSEPDHVSYVRQYGQCYGNCGGGCPGGNQTLTADCHNHDQCVRNGHALASGWCNDEFTSASDDEFYAPRCSGT